MQRKHQKRRRASSAAVGRSPKALAWSHVMGSRVTLDRKVCGEPRPRRSARIAQSGPLLPFLDQASVRILFLFIRILFLILSRAHFARFVCPQVWCVGKMPWRRSRVHRARNASMAEFPSQVPHAIFLAARSCVALAIAQIQQGATAELSYLPSSLIPL